MLRDYTVKTTNAGSIHPGGTAKSFQHTLPAILTMFALLAISALSSLAQQITGSITGTVKDEQGAVVNVSHRQSDQR